LASGIALVLLIGVGACSNDDPRRSADQRTTTTRATTSTSSTTTTTKPKSGYVKAKVDPSLPRQDIDINLRYPASFTPAQVEVVQAWANYRHVFFTTLDPPQPDSPLLAEVADAQVTESNRQQRISFKEHGWVATLRGHEAYRETVSSVAVTGPSAALRTCQVDSSVQTGSDGSVIDDQVITKLTRPSFERRDGKWIVTQGTEIRRWEGDQEATCLAL
jgi:hypothetical protein